MQSLKLSSLVAILSQASTTLLALITIPIFANKLGSAHYGLVAFYTTLISLSQLFDLGLAGTASRHVSRLFATNQHNEHRKRNLELVNSAEALIVLISAVLLAVGLLARPALDEFLRATETVGSDAAGVLALMLACVAVRFPLSFYSWGLIGAERHLRVSILNVAFAAGRFLVPALMFLSGHGSLIRFFELQLVFSILEMVWFWISFRKIVPFRLSSLDSWPGGARSILIESLPLAAGVVLWTAIVQTDKVLLARSVNLSEYGQAMISIQLANGLNTLAPPILQTFRPRTAILIAQDKWAESFRLFRLITRLVAFLAGWAACILALYGKDLVTLWTGNENFGTASTGVVGPYAAGNAITAVSGLLFILQHATGNFRQNMLGSLIFSGFLLPLYFVIIPRFGAQGSAWVWASTSLIFLAIWCPYALKSYPFSSPWMWLMRDCFVPGALSLMSVYASKFLLNTLSVHAALIGLALSALCVAILALASDSQIRSLLVWPRPNKNLQ